METNSIYAYINGFREVIIAYVHMYLETNSNVYFNEWL